MKKRTVLLTLLLICCMLTGALAEGEIHGYDQVKGYVYVTLGQYPQTVDGGTPGNARLSWTWGSNRIKDTTGLTFEKTPIIWRVLSADDEKLYLCSEYVLFAHRMHTDMKEYKKIGGDFGQTELSRLLNTEFADEAFTEDEKAMLLENGSQGKVFLLTASDVHSKAYGMTDGNGLRAWGTEYAIRVTGLFVYRVSRGAHSCYWVSDQSPGIKTHARCTKAQGTLGHLIADRDDEGVRPAVYVDAGAYAIAGGTGRINDPYVLVRGE